MYKKVFLTGANGFVGKNISSFLEGRYQINSYNRNQIVSINENIVIHLAGKAHDVKNTTTSDEYYQVNTELTKTIFDAFLTSEAEVFIILSSVKSVADELDGMLVEEHIPNPITHYGKSKQLAEQYILSKPIPKGKRVYILRPCMIHGPGNKGNLNLLYKVVNKGFPWPLGSFENKRSFCCIDNLSFVINELIMNDSVPSGVYNIADDEPITTNNLIKLIAETQGRRYRIWNIPVYLIKFFSKVGDIIKLPLNTERLNKLTETYIVSNNKIKTAINKQLPISSKEGLKKTLNSFNTNAK
jgi:nucleoside-diphosphate-sugar epimerase